MARSPSSFVREDQLLTFEGAVRKMTSYPAALFGLPDRGVIRPGAYADLVLCNPLRLRDRASFAKPRQLAAGIETVLVNGQVAFTREHAPARLAGTVIKR